MWWKCFIIGENRYEKQVQSKCGSKVKLGFNYILYSRPLEFKVLFFVTLKPWAAVHFQVLLRLLCSQWCVHVLSFGSSAGHSPRQRGTPLLPVLQGKWVPGSRGSLPSCFPCLEEARGSETSLPVTPNYLHECDCACSEGCSRLCVCVCVRAYEIYLCRDLLRAHLSFSRFNIHLLCVNTVAMFSWEADTSNLSMSL